MGMHVSRILLDALIQLVDGDEIVLSIESVGVVLAGEQQIV